MKRQVFFSFHYGNDVWRVGQIRNIGTIEGQEIFSDNGWEKVRLKSDAAIKAWIDKELNMRSCVVVLIGCKCQYKNVQKVENKNVHFPTILPQIEPPGRLAFL